MRNLILLVIFGIGGWWLYQRYLNPASVPPPTDSPPQIAAAPGVFTMPDPVAWKEILRTTDMPAPLVGVVLVDGNRWRFEIKEQGKPGVLVSVFDGTNFVSVPKVISSPIMIDGASVMRNLFTEIEKLKPVGTGERDGHFCWLFKHTSAQGTRAEIWMDRETFFPVFIEAWQADGTHRETHIQLLKSDFNILRKTAFDTRFAAPMLTPFLNQ